MGAVGAALGAPKISHADESAPLSASGRGILVYEGTVAELNGDMIHVNVEGNSVVAAITPATALWRGGSVNVSSLHVGDNLLMHVQSGYVAKAWSNLQRIRGIITGGSGSRYVLHGSHGYGAQSDFGLQINSETSLEKGQAGTASDLTRLPIGTIVDAVGLMDDSVLHATLLSYGLPDHIAQPQMNADPPSSVTRSARNTALGPLALCDTTYWGYASYFSCYSSLAKCQTCSYSGGSLSGQGACAWPKVTTYGLCDSTSGCKNQSAAWCGKDIDVYDRCGGMSLPCAVVDCGPCQNSTCSPNLCNGPNMCSVCVTSYTPIVDLTVATFSLFYDPNKQKCFAAECINTISC